MNFWFAGSYTSEQAAGAINVRDALMLDLDGWPITLELAFSEDPDPSQPDEFAITQQIAFDHYLISFRDDAPHFQNGPSAAHYDIARFYQETVAHEMGHVLSFALNDLGQALLSRLFNTDNTTEAWFPATSQWVDRPGEAIAETFKEAFLPVQFREYPIRTNVRLKYAFYPLFRAIFRNAVTADLLRDAESMLQLPEGELGSSTPGGIIGGIEIEGGVDDPNALSAPAYSEDDLLDFGGSYGTSLHVPISNPWSVHDGNYEAYVDTGVVDSAGESTAGFLIEPGTEFDWTFDFPGTAFFTPYSGVYDSTDIGSLPGSVFDLGAPNEARFTLRVYIGLQALSGGLASPGLDASNFYNWEGRYLVRDYWPNFPSSTGRTNILVRYSDVLGSGPPFAAADSFTIPGSSDPASFLLYACQTALQPVRIHSSVKLNNLVGFESIYADQAAVDDILPVLPFTQAAYPACPTGSAPISTVPPEPSLLAPGGHESGSRIVTTPVSGSRAAATKG